MEILKIEGLCKQYHVFSLKNVSFSMESGMVMGFIGRNGAGDVYKRQDRADRVVRPYKRPQRSLQIPVFTEHEIGEEIENGAEE